MRQSCTARPNPHTDLHPKQLAERPGVGGARPGLDMGPGAVSRGSRARGGDTNGEEKKRRMKDKAATYYAKL